MYKKLPKLADANLVILANLAKEVAYTDKNRRLGLNGYEKFSIYNYSKWSTWTKPQRDAFKKCFDQKLIDKSVIGWLLNFPKKIGFLDVMNYWVNQQLAGHIVAYALVEQSIWINNERVHVAKGEGIQFSLKMLHEVKPEDFDQTWACMMTLTEYA